MISIAAAIILGNLTADQPDLVADDPSIAGLQIAVLVPQALDLGSQQRNSRLDLFDQFKIMIGLFILDRGVHIRFYIFSLCHSGYHSRKPTICKIAIDRSQYKDGDRRKIPTIAACVFMPQ